MITDKKNNTHHNNALKFSLVLALTIVVVISNTAIAPALTLMKNALHVHDTTLIQLILSSTSLAQIPGSLISMYIGSKINAKYIILWGLLSYALVGLASMFITNIYVMLIARFVFGLSVGLITPYTLSLIAILLPAGNKQKYTAYAKAFSNSSITISSIFIGYLVKHTSWQYAFAIYGLAIVVFFLVIFILPPLPPKKKGEMTEKFNRKAIFLSIAILLISGGYYAFISHASLYLKNFHLGDSDIAGICIAISGISATVGALSTVKINAWLKSYSISVKIILQVIALSIPVFFINLYAFYLAFCLSGICWGLLSSEINFRIITSAKYKENAHVYTSIGLSATYLGMFSSPILTRTVGFIISGIQYEFLFYVIALSLLTIYSLINRNLSKGIYQNET